MCLANLGFRFSSFIFRFSSCFKSRFVGIIRFLVLLLNNLISVHHLKCRCCCIHASINVSHLDSVNLRSCKYTTKTNNPISILIAGMGLEMSCRRNNKAEKRKRNREYARKFRAVEQSGPKVCSKCLLIDSQFLSFFM